MLRADFARFAGRTSLLSRGKFTAIRRGDRIEIEGTVTHFWGHRDKRTRELLPERYDFHEGKPGAREAHVLERYGRAKPFDFAAQGRQSVTGFVPIAYGELGKPRVTWKDIDG